MLSMSKEVPWYLDDGTAHVYVVGARGATGLVLTIGNEVFEESGRSLVSGTLDYLQGLKMLVVKRTERVLPTGTPLTVVGENKDVTEAIQKIAAAYDCKIVEGVCSHQLKQFVIDGNTVVLNIISPDTRVDDAEFEENEVYTIDVVTSTGEGKPKLLDERQTTIYKRAVDKTYHSKMKASRSIFSEISQKFPIVPFAARALEEEQARLGLVECVNHDLLQPYPILHEKPGGCRHIYASSMCFIFQLATAETNVEHKEKARS